MGGTAGAEDQDALVEVHPVQEAVVQVPEQVQGREGGDQAQDQALQLLRELEAGEVEDAAEAPQVG
ncbi:MAG: hypothetical protein R3F17_15400 [Planctomycetota bacterium]